MSENPAPNDAETSPAERDVPTGGPGSTRHQHLGQLDGWRGISILCVLAAHMLPLGPKALGLNETTARFGMCVFFSLSGFLIATFLINRPDVRAFLIRRLCRILPLAYLYATLTLVLFGGDAGAWLANFAFLLNYEHEYLRREFYNSHLWSLCVEVHFYLTVAALVLVCGVRGMYCLPILCGAVTAYRVATGTHISILTHLRVDEILAGSCLALALSGRARPYALAAARRVPTGLGALLLAASSSQFTGDLQYVRPYAAALMIGSTLAQPDRWFTRQLYRRSLAYVATISYALYIIHPITEYGWLDEGDSIIKYCLKRPISFILAFCLAHLSTFYWEYKWIGLGKWLTKRSPSPGRGPAVDRPSHATAE